MEREREVMDGVGGDFTFLRKGGDKSFLYKHSYALSFLMFLLLHNSVFMLSCLTSIMANCVISLIFSISISYSYGLLSLLYSSLR